jgi:hypothetical protein
LVVTGLLTLVALPNASAETLEYLLDVPEGQPLTFVLEFRVQFAGDLAIDAEWEGTRQLSFRLEGPGNPAIKARRFGLSPQRLEFVVDEPLAGYEKTWNLVIRALPARGRAAGKVRIRLPERAPVALTPEDRRDPTPVPEIGESWARPARPPSGATTEIVALFEAVEGLRAWAIDDRGSRRDACGWQTDFVRYVVDYRDEAAAGGWTLDDATTRFLQRATKVIAAIEELRTSDDPILAGPVPEDEEQRRAWLRLRQERIRAVEDELDALGESIRRKYAPELSAEPWPQRFIGCLMACQRYFEQRTRLGEERATNQDLARSQWDGFLAAGRAIEAMVTSAEDSPGDGSQASLPPEPRGGS